VGLNNKRQQLIYLTYVLIQTDGTLLLYLRQCLSSLGEILTTDRTTYDLRKMINISMFEKRAAANTVFTKIAGDLILEISLHN
jgi:hypothetical protein